MWVDGVGWLENGNSVERDQGHAGEHGFHELLAICLNAVSGSPDRSKLRKGGFIMAYSYESPVHHGGGGVVAGV